MCVSGVNVCVCLMCVCVGVCGCVCVCLCVKRNEVILFDCSHYLQDSLIYYRFSIIGVSKSSSCPPTEQLIKDTSYPRSDKVRLR